MDGIIKNLSYFLKDDLEQYEKCLSESVNSNVKLINQIVGYILKKKGKRFRPMLCILCAGLDGKPNNATYLSASSVELLHVATLLHDDVVDEATLRRGWPTVNSIWKNKLSILVGDYMFSKSLINISKLHNVDCLDILSEISSRLSEGEILQIENAINKDMTENTYFKMISDKTASLLSASCLLGYISTSNGKKKSNIKKFGEYLGISYQLKDDLFDILGSFESTGKKSKLDLKKNLLTLPYIHMLNNVDIKKRKKIISKLKYHYKKKDLKEIKNLINVYDGIDYTNSKIKEYSLLAIKELDDFEDSEYKDFLVQAVEFNYNRKF